MLTQPKTSKSAIATIAVAALTFCAANVVGWFVLPTNGIVLLDLPYLYALASPLIVNSASDVSEDEKVHDPLPGKDAITLEWYREHLGSEDKTALYDTIEAAILGRKGSVAVPQMSEDEVYDCFWAVIYDHPEYFWVDKNYIYYYGANNKVTEFELVYHETDKTAIEEKWYEYEEKADTVISEAAFPLQADSRLLQIYTWICNSTIYEEGDRDQDMSGVFDEKTAVCAGYVQALQFMALRAGIPCVRISGHEMHSDGEVGDGNHTWLAAAPNGFIRYYDVTWDDMGTTPLIHYYAMTQEECERRHVFASDIAPRYNYARDDSDEMVALAYRTFTGEPVEIIRESPELEPDYDRYFQYSSGGNVAGEALSPIKDGNEGPTNRGTFHDVLE